AQRLLWAASLSRNLMPPRTTRKSHRPRLSDRTMVGTAQPLCLSASETEGRRYEMTMNLGKREITAPHYNAGLDDEMPSSRRGSVFLDIPFYRTALSKAGLGCGLGGSGRFRDHDIFIRF